MLKKIIIIITIIIALFLLVFGLARLTRNTNPISQKIDENNLVSDFFSFENLELGFLKDAVNNIEDSILGGDQEDIAEDKRLSKVSSMPVSGYGIIQKEKFVEVPDVEKPIGDNQIVVPEGTEIAPPEIEYVSIARYADRNNGNIYQTTLDKIDERKFSETEIPRAYETLFTNKSLIVRYLDGGDISTFIGEIPEEKLGWDVNNGNEIFGDFLPINIKDISISKDKNKIFYLTNTQNGVLGFTAKTNGADKKQVFSSPFSEWISDWVDEENILLTSRPSGEVPGYSYLLDLKTLDYKKILGNINGLTSLISKSDLILYSDENLSIKIYDINQKKSRNLRSRTHTEKCVWSKDGITLYCAIPKEIPNGFTYPDIWYQGEISYDDEIFKINTDTGEKTKISDLSLENGGETIDAINLSLDHTEERLFFMNKKDSYLWRINLF